MHKLEFVQENETHKNIWDSEIQTDRRILSRRLNLDLSNKKKRTCYQVLSADNRVNPHQKKNQQKTKKKNENINKYFDLARGLKKLWNMRVIAIPIVVSGLRTISNGLEEILEEMKIRRRIETIQTTALLRSARILRRALEI